MQTAIPRVLLVVFYFMLQRESHRPIIFATKVVLGDNEIKSSKRAGTIVETNIKKLKPKNTLESKHLLLVLITAFLAKTLFGLKK